MQRIAIIDIGSNSARLVISHLYKNGAYNMVYNQKEALRLSQKVNAQNLLTEEAFSSTIETMKSFAYMCKIYQADKTIAVATAAIRNSQNGAELVARVAEETGRPAAYRRRRHSTYCCQNNSAQQKISCDENPQLCLYHAGLSRLLQQTAQHKSGAAQKNLRSEQRAQRYYSCRQQHYPLPARSDRRPQAHHLRLRSA